MPPGPTPASGNPTAIEFFGRTAPSASGRCGMGLPNAPTAYTDVCRRWRVPVRHSGRFSGVAAAASTAVVVGGRLGYRAYEDHRTAMARGTCVSAAADLDRAAKECRNPLGADATKSARPSSIIQIDRNLLETKLDRLVAEKVTEPLNAMPGASGRRDRQRRQIRAQDRPEGVPRRPLRAHADRQGRQVESQGAQIEGRPVRVGGDRTLPEARIQRRGGADGDVPRGREHTQGGRHQPAAVGRADAIPDIERQTQEDLQGDRRVAETPVGIRVPVRVRGRHVAQGTWRT